MGGVLDTGKHAGRAHARRCHALWHTYAWRTTVHLV
jgi:hypothetical protein